MFDFDSYYQKLLKREIYFDDFPKGRLKRFKDKTFSLLQENIKNKDVDGLATTLAVMYYDGADRDYTDILLKLLDENWYFRGGYALDEDIIEVLGLIKDPKSIDKLYEIAINVPDYDDMRAVAKKCMWALNAIDTVEAIEKLRLLAVKDDWIISEFATERLEDLLTQK